MEHLHEVGDTIVDFDLDEKYLPKAVAVPDESGETPTAAEFNALLAALRDAGYLATS